MLAGDHSTVTTVTHLEHSQSESQNHREPKRKMGSLRSVSASKPEVQQFRGGRGKGEGMGGEGGRSHLLSDPLQFLPSHIATIYRKMTGSFKNFF